MEINLNFNTNPEIKNNRKYFNETNENLVNVAYDSQGLFWNRNDRERQFRTRKLYHHGYRCVPLITTEEKKTRRLFHRNKKCDIFFQYKHSYPNIPVKYTHFQVRKNFYVLKNEHNIFNELIYSKPYGIESFNTINQRQQTLCSLSSEDENNFQKQMICFDVIRKSNGDYLICTGRCDGSVNLYTISRFELDRVKEYKTNITPKFENFLSKSISQGNSADILTNYVKFLKEGEQIYLLTTGNDGLIQIFDLDNDMKIKSQIKCEYAINNCNFNDSGNILGCVGDSVYVDLLDMRLKEKVNQFRSHYDYGIVLKFQPGNEHVFATGNQDYSCKIWDMRNLSSNFNSDKIEKPVKFLSGYFESIGDLLFTTNNSTKDQFLIFAENADYLHVYNLKYDRIQTLNYLGEFNGLAYDDNLSQIYLGYQDQKQGILVYDQIKPNIDYNLESNFI
jgi:WD40 repeat protein